MSGILYCHCADAGVLPFGVRDNVLKRLCEGNFSFIAVSDLCGQAVRPNQIIKNFIADDGFLILACYPRAVKSLFEQLKKPLSQSVKLGNIRRQNLKELFELVEQYENNATAPAAENSIRNAHRTIKLRIKRSEKLKIVRFLLDNGFSAFVLSENGGDCLVVAENENWAGSSARDGDLALMEIIKVESVDHLCSLIHSAFSKNSSKWHPWFPVIDQDRCSQCLQCLSFCLFGVYDVDGDGRLNVMNPEKCKTNCPACARVCPDMAIIFPKYSSEPINGGEIPAIMISATESQKVDVKSLLEGDFYEKLKQRNMGRKERFLPSQTIDNKQLAEIERQHHLEKISSDITPDVLASLPSQEELKKLAEEAAQRARKAMNMKNKEIK